MTNWITSLERFASVKIKNIEEIQGRILLSDLYRLNNLKKKSLNKLNELVSLTNKMNIGSNLKRQIFSRHYLEESLKERQAIEWRKYLSGFGGLPKRTKKMPWIVRYLDAKNFSNQNKNLPCATCWKNTINSNIAREFVVEWYKIYGCL